MFYYFRYPFSLDPMLTYIGIYFFQIFMTCATAFMNHSLDMMQTNLIVIAYVCFKNFGNRLEMVSFLISLEFGDAYCLFYFKLEQSSLNFYDNLIRNIKKETSYIEDRILAERVTFLVHRYMYSRNTKGPLYCQLILNCLHFKELLQ